MKKIILLVAALCSLNMVVAQEALTNPGSTAERKPNKPKPEMMAGRHSNHLQKMLGLSDEQKQKTYEAMLTRFNEVHAIKEKAGATTDKKALREQTKPARQKFVQTMNTILTPEQKTKWAEHRAKMKGSGPNTNMKGTPPPASGNGDIKKLTDDEDGIMD